MAAAAAGTTRSSSAWRPASARPTGCCRRARPRPRRAATSSSATSRRTAGPRPRPRRRASSGSRAAGSTTADTALEEMDLPAIFERAPELALIDELAHTNAPGLEHAQALRGHRRRARRRHRRLLDRQRPAPREPQRPGRRADRRARARDVPRRRPRQRRRGRPHRPHPRGADRAPARGQDLPGRAGRRPRSTTSSRSRTSPRCARSRCARSPRRSRRSARAAASAARHPRASAVRARAAGGRRAAARAGHARARARSAWCAAPGARRSGSAPSSTCSTSRRPASRAARRRSASSSRRCAGSRRSSARSCSSRRATTSPRSPAAVAARARHHLRPDRPAAAAHAASAACASPLPERLMRELPGVDVRIVADRTREEGTEPSISSMTLQGQPPPAAADGTSRRGDRAWARSDSHCARGAGTSRRVAIRPARAARRQRARAPAGFQLAPLVAQSAFPGREHRLHAAGVPRWPATFRDRRWRLDPGRRLESIAASGAGMSAIRFSPGARSPAPTGSSGTPATLRSAGRPPGDLALGRGDRLRGDLGGRSRRDPRASSQAGPRRLLPRGRRGDSVGRCVSLTDDQRPTGAPIASASLVSRPRRPDARDGGSRGERQGHLARGAGPQRRNRDRHPVAGPGGDAFRRRGGDLVRARLPYFTTKATARLGL